MHGQNYGQLIIILITDIYLLTISQQDIYIIHPFTIERPLPFRNLIPVKKFACMYPVILVPVNISPLKLHKTHTSFFFFYDSEWEILLLFFLRRDVRVSYVSFPFMCLVLTWQGHRDTGDIDGAVTLFFFQSLVYNARLKFLSEYININSATYYNFPSFQHVQCF